MTFQFPVSAPSGGPSDGAGELRRQVHLVRRELVQASLLGMVAGLLALLPSWYMLEVYDRVVNSRSGMTLAMVSLAALLAYGLTALQEWGRGSLLQAAALRFDAGLDARVFDAALAGQRRRLAAGGPQALADLRSLRELMVSPAFYALFELPMVLLCFGLLYALNPWIGIAAVLAALTQVGIGWFNQQHSGKLLAEANRHAQAAHAQAERTLLQAPVVLALGMLPGLFGRWQQRHAEALQLQARASTAAGSAQAASRFVQNAVNSGFLGLSAWFLLHGQLQGGAGMLIVAGILGGRALAPFVQVITQWSSVQQAGEAWQRLSALLQAEPVPAPAMPLPAPQGQLRVEALSLLLPGSTTPLLRDLQFSLQRGEVLVVLGASGAGKSTLARVLLGLVTPSQGKVRLDGVDVATWPKSQLGSHLGYLPQGVELLDGSLADNICRFGERTPEATAALQAVIDAAGLGSLVDSLPAGLDTRLGPDGARLSGGQRQRVALARALYGQPSLVVLDEPNAHLDEEGDAALLRLIDAARRQGSTFVVMTHRSGVLQVADRVLVLHEGQQKAFGPRDEILAALQAAAQSAAQSAAQATAQAPRERQAVPALQQ